MTHQQSAVTAARVLFRGPSVWVHDELYGKDIAGSAQRTREAVTIPPHGRFHTNTYFGRFEASYWRRWTGVREVTVTVTTAGSGDVTVLLRASDIGSHERTVDVATVPAGATATVTGPLDKFLDGGAMWLEFRAGSGAVTVEDGRWEVPAGPRADTPTHVAICTFNRADDCARTVASLASDPEIIGLLGGVHVTDQGTDHVDTRECYQTAALALGELLHYRRQPNLGGAGGFTRGLVEATASGADVNVLIMDDDVRVEPEAVLRLTALANAATHPILVGAQMLYLYNPDALLVSAEEVDFRGLQAGLPSDEFCLQDESVIDNVQERRIDAGYNAWWSCLVPSSVISEVGLPLPYFFQWDDIEYGVRCRDAGHPSVTLPGAAVWHADFYWKDSDDFGQFFSLRNSLITAMTHRKATPRQLATAITSRILHRVAGLQYGYAHTYLRAVEAYLEGPEGLADGGREALARIRAERAEYPDTRQLDPSEIPVRLPVMRSPTACLKEGREDLVLAKRLLQQRLGRIAPGPVAVTYEDAHWWHVGSFAHVFVTDGGQNAVRERRYDAATSAALRSHLVGVIRRFLREGETVAERYRAAMPELTGRANWERLFES